MNLDKKRTFIVNTLYFGIMLLLAVVLLKYALPLLAPFVIGFVLAYLLKRPIRFASHKLHISRKAAAIALVLVFYCTIGLLLALLGMLTPQAYSTASLDVRDIQDLLQALQWEPDRVSAFWPDLCDACRTLYRLSGEQLDIYVRLTQPAYAADLHLVEPDTLPPS